MSELQAMRVRRESARARANRWPRLDLQRSYGELLTARTRLPVDLVVHRLEEVKLLYHRTLLLHQRLRTNRRHAPAEPAAG